MTVASQVLRALGDAVVALDRTGAVIVWNPAAERTFGFRSQEVLGRQLPDLGVRLETLVLGRERRLTLQRRGGHAFPATVVATPYPGPNGDVEGLALVVKDLSSWIGAAGDDVASADAPAVEERLGAAFRGIVEATGADLDRGGRLEPLAQSLAEQGRRLLPGVSCSIAWIPPARQDLLVCLAGAGPFAEGLVGQSYPRAAGVTEIGLAAGRPVESSDIQRTSPQADLFAAGGIHTMRSIPMRIRQRMADGRRALGAIFFFRAEARPFTRQERRLLDDFGALVAISMQRAEFRAATERSMAQLQLAVDVALDLARSLDVSEVVRRLVRRAAVASRADRCALLRVEGGEAGELVTVDAYDTSGQEGATGFRRPVAAQQLLYEAVRSRVPVTGGRHNPGPLPPVLQAALADVLQSAVVPLLYGGEVVAVLVLSRRTDAPFTQEELDTVVLLGGPAALALRNSFLYQQTEEASRVKTDFLDMAAHELRTPLTVISGYLSILREGAFGTSPMPWKEPLRILDRKATELRRLVDDLLLAARLETGRLLSVLESVDLREVVELAGLEAPEVALPEAPVMVQGDREQLSRLVEHLVANALSYGREGAPPWARLELEACPEVGQARLRVEDRGRGLPADAAESIFERFARIEDPEQPVVPGTGLGLYIARELARRHGGRLSLEWTRAGAGSRFVLTLPLL